MDEPASIIACQRGNLEAFAGLYDLYVQKIFSFIYYRVGSKEVAEDITSEVFFKAMNQIQSFNANKGVFSAWLYRIARNSVIDYYRTKKPILDLEVLADASTDENIAEQVALALQGDKLKIVLKNLSPEMHEVVVMRIWDELSYTEIAGITGKTEANLRVMFSRAVQKLKEFAHALILILAFITF